MTQKDIQTLCNTLWDTYCEVYPSLVKFDAPRIILSNRLTKTAGYNHSDDNSITLGAKFIAQFRDNMLNVILPHEIAHQIDFNLFGWHNGKKHHGKHWVNIMIAIGQEPKVYHNMELSK